MTFSRHFGDIFATFCGQISDISIDIIGKNSYNKDSDYRAKEK